jgi:hypothetical protein
MPIYLERTRMGFLNLLYGLVLQGVWKACLLTPPPQSHSHHTRMSERVSVPCREVEPYRPICPPPAISNDPSATAGSSPYPSRPDSATYGRPEFAPSAYSQRPPQPTAIFGMCSAHPMPRPRLSLLLSYLRRVGPSCPFPRRSRNARPH